MKRYWTGDPLGPGSIPASIPFQDGEAFAEDIYQQNADGSETLLAPKGVLLPPRYFRLLSENLSDPEPVEEASVEYEPILPNGGPDPDAPEGTTTGASTEPPADATAKQKAARKGSANKRGGPKAAQNK